MTTLTGEIMTIIQKTYGDATQTVLDRRCAEAIEAHIQKAGWTSPEITRAMVASAGGHIDLREADVLDPPDMLILHTPSWTGDTRRVSVRRSKTGSRQR